MTDDEVRNGQIAYQIYGLTTHNETYSGLPMLQWEDLPPVIQQAWANVGNLMAQSFTSIESWMQTQEAAFGIKRLSARNAPPAQEFKGG